VRPSATTAEGHEVRYTARGDDVFAYIQGARGTVTLADVAATPTTTVTRVDGTRLPWRNGPEGLSVDLPTDPTTDSEADPEPVVVVFGQVDARAVDSEPGS
jgi:hypothetical protein